MIKFDEFSIHSTASREKSEAQLYDRSPAQQKRVDKQKEIFARLVLKLEAFCSKLGSSEIKNNIAPVIAALKSLIESPSFEPDRRDKDIIKAATELTTLNPSIYEDIKIRYNADCRLTAEKIERRQFNVLSYKNTGYKLTASERKERRERLKQEKTEQTYSLAQSSISEYNSQIAEFEKLIDAKKQSIAKTDSETKAIGLLREIKNAQRYIAQRRNLIELNNRIVNTIDSERFLSEKDKLISQMDTKRQAKIIQKAQKLYQKEKLVDGFFKYTEKSIEALTKQAATSEELQQIREVKSKQRDFSFADQIKTQSEQTKSSQTEALQEDIDFLEN